jgi:hypothetical protein
MSFDIAAMVKQLERLMKSGEDSSNFGTGKTQRRLPLISLLVFQAIS